MTDNQPIRLCAYCHRDLTDDAGTWRVTYEHDPPVQLLFCGWRCFESYEALMP